MQHSHGMRPSQPAQPDAHVPPAQCASQSRHLLPRAAQPLDRLHHLRRQAGKGGQKHAQVSSAKQPGQGWNRWTCEQQQQQRRRGGGGQEQAQSKQQQKNRPAARAPRRSAPAPPGSSPPAHRRPAPAGTGPRCPASPPARWCEPPPPPCHASQNNKGQGEVSLESDGVQKLRTAVECGVE